MCKKKFNSFMLSPAHFANKLKYAVLKMLPLRCILCHNSLENDDLTKPWCDPCQAELPRTARCKKCGLQTPHDCNGCNQCINTVLPWDSLTCISRYGYPYDKLLHRFKYQGQFWLAKPLAKMLAKEITSPAPQLLAVPMHWQRRVMRGFNHSQLLAAHLAAQLQVSCAENTLKRTRATQPQQALNRQQRMTNLKNAFKITGSCAKHVAIVDDVVTTGATVKAICQELKLAGAEKIDVYCLARTVYNPHSLP
ncbi:MAG: ComF family protein [Vibrionaceae bacterium]